MKNFWAKYKSRVTPSEFNLMYNLPDEDWKMLGETFDEIISNYVGFMKGTVFDLEYNRPIVVCSNRKTLLKVKGYFYLKMHDLPRYQYYSVEDLLKFDNSSNRDDSEDYSFVNCPGLAVLYLDKNTNEYGNFKSWIDSCVVSKLTERSRRENLTLVLSEITLGKKINDIEEFNVIHLTDKTGKIEVVEVKNSASVSNNTSGGNSWEE